MYPSDNYKQAQRAYAGWFFAGAFLGFVISFITGKFLFVLPIILGMICGAVAFDRTINKSK